MFSGHSSPLLHLCHLLATNCLEVCVSCKTSPAVIQLAECDQDGMLHVLRYRLPGSHYIINIARNSFDKLIVHQCPKSPMTTVRVTKFFISVIYIDN